MAANTLALLELVLVSPAFAQVLSAAEQQTLLDGMLQNLSRAHPVDVIRLLTAHGARVNSHLAGEPNSRVLIRAANTYDPPRIEAVVRDGVFTVGDTVIDGMATFHTSTVKLLLGYGCRPVNASGCLHHVVAAGPLKAVQDWLKLMCVDIDARDWKGRTPLMHAAWVRASINRKLVLDQTGGAPITKLLLKYGASVTVKDRDDKTPLRHAVGSNARAAAPEPGAASNSCNPEALRLLLQHGADPSQATQGDQVVLDFLNLEWLDDEGITRQLEYLLAYGANPCLVGKRGVAAVDRLQKSKEGRAFIAAHPQWFVGI